MNCGEFQECVNDVARGARVDGAAEHAAVCPRCAAELVDQRALAAGLGALAVATRVEAPAHLHRVLAAVVAERGRRRAVPRWWYVAAAAAGAVLLLLVGPFGKVQPPVAHPSATAPERHPPRAEPSEMLARRQPVAEPTRSLRARREPAVEFQPLDYAAGLTPIEAGQVVRVTLPVGGSSGKMVKADLLVGEDGVARAIRFVK